MIAELGHFALLLALSLCIAQTFLGFAAARRSDPGLLAGSSRAAVAQFSVIAVAFAMLTTAYVQSDFTLLNVFQNSHTAKPLLYKFTGVWGNHEGSMLLWVLILSLFGACVGVFARHLDLRLKGDVLGVQGLVGIAFLLFITLTSNPFARIQNPPLDGRDLNPLLQDPGLAFHPPLLYVGYVGLSVTFAFAVAALIEGRVDAAWARWVRPWTLVSWVALTLGIALGSWWAYYELGWGGFWFWDPVENASLMPWIVATALLHSAIVVERRETLKTWTVFLAILAFSFSLLGTFLVRSGVLTSVHAFATDPGRGLFILGILTLTIGGSLLLFALRGASLKSTSTFGFVSRETALLVNNAVLVTVAATIFIGTVFPIVAKPAGYVVSIGAPYFNLVVPLLMAPLLLLVPFGPMMGWKRAELLAAAQRLWVAGLVSFITIICILSFLVSGPIAAVLAMGLGVWLIGGAISDLAAKAQLGSASLAVTKSRLKGLPRSAFGTALAHGGLGIVILGAVATSVWQQEVVVSLGPGEETSIAGYRVVFETIGETQGPNYQAIVAKFGLYDGTERIATLLPEKRVYPVTGMPTTEAAIETTGAADVYAVIGDVQPDGGRTVRLYYNPLAPWIWFGAALMALGGLVSLSDRRLRVGVPGLKRARPVAVPAE
jgi:cytochrome c-type biogenesis protein CcmF